MRASRRPWRLRLTTSTSFRAHRDEQESREISARRPTIAALPTRETLGTTCDAPFLCNGVHWLPAIPAKKNHTASSPPLLARNAQQPGTSLRLAVCLIGLIRSLAFVDRMTLLNSRRRNGAQLFIFQWLA
jgi:hypothetical protein